MEKKKSSIEWLEEQLHLGRELSTIIQQAKAMHKEEVESAYFNGSADRLNDEGSFKQYYNETFGGNNEQSNR